MSDAAIQSTGSSVAAPRDRIFWGFVVSIAIADIVTKRWAERALMLHTPEDVFPPWLRWTLTYNTGAAMNLSVGAWSRVVFSMIALGMIGYLFVLYRQASPAARATPAALALIAAGALGNLLDRLRHTKGVVDFIDVGTTEWRFWTFNVADMGVTSGAILLALLLWREGNGEPTDGVVHSQQASPESSTPIPTSSESHSS